MNAGPHNKALEQTNGTPARIGVPFAAQRQCCADVARTDGGAELPVLNCPRCIPIPVPETLSPELRSQAAAIVQRGSGAEAMKLLHDEAGVSLADAKAIVFHLARRPGHCQRCGADIVPGETAYCPQCQSLTITW